MQTPDARLLTAAAFVRQGAVFADVGTDHAYLPIYLVATGRVSRAVAADIGEGPIALARANIAAAGLSDRIEAVMTDGLFGLSEKGITDITICGMGGELISRILQDAPFVKKEGIRLILQPMSRAATLRRYLAENGYAILAERPCRAAGRVYSCLCAEYDGIPRAISPAEAEVGNPTLEAAEEKDAFSELLARKIKAVREKIDGLRAAALPTGEDEALLKGLLEIQEKHR